MTLGRFAGAWSVDRAVVDARAGLDGVLRGTARFEPTADGGLAYVEEGLLTFAGSTHRAGRRLLLRAGPGASVDVLFADGRPFYGFDVVGERWSGEHACGRDVYTVQGRFLDADRFEEVWHAAGPDKDYCLTTVYRRAPGPRAPVSPAPWPG